MTWVKFDDHMDEHPKIVALDDGSFRLWISAMCYANRALTDGFIPRNMLRRLTGAANPEKHAAALVAQRLWTVAEGGWTIHDYAEYQPSREAILTEREATRKRVQEFRDRKRQRNAATDAGAETTAGNAVTPPVTDTVSNADVTASPYPFPAPCREPNVKSNATEAYVVNAVAGDSQAHANGRAREKPAVDFSFSDGESVLNPDHEHAPATDRTPARIETRTADDSSCVPNENSTYDFGDDELWLDDEPEATGVAAYDTTEARRQFRALTGYLLMLDPEDMPDDLAAADPEGWAAWQQIAPRYAGHGAPALAVSDAIADWSEYHAWAGRPTVAAFLLEQLGRDPLPATDDPDGLADELALPYWSESRNEQYRDWRGRFDRPGDDLQARKAWRQAVADRLDFPAHGYALHMDAQDRAWAAFVSASSGQVRPPDFPAFLTYCLTRNPPATHAEAAR